MEVLNKETYYQHTNLGLAAALVCKGYTLECLEPETDGSDHYVFYHKADKSTMDTVNSYWTGKCDVDAQKYNQTYQSIKSRIYTKQGAH